MKTLIAIPCMDTVPVGFAESLLNLHKPDGTKVCFKGNSLVYDSRNILSLTAIENNFEVVMWLYSDMIVPPDTIEKFAAYCAEGKEMVTGLYVRRRPPVKPVIYDQLDEPGRDADGKLTSRLHAFEDYPRNDLFRVEACGFGCVMTKVDLLKRVWEKFGPAFAPYPWAGEDISFCFRVKQLGVPIYCDSSVSCGHVGTFIFTEEVMQ